MRTFESLEDAIVELEGLSSPEHWNQRPLIRKMSLARPDYSPVKAMARQIKKNLGLTAAQQILAIRLITKYSKQWKKLGYSVSNINSDTSVRLGTREVDRTRSMDIDPIRNIITINFLYNPKLIKILYRYSEIRSAGTVEYSKDRHRWELSITPEHVEFMRVLGSQHNFKFGDRLLLTMHELDHAFDYNDITLDIVDNELVMANGPVSMIEWLDKKVGPFTIDNYANIAAYSSSMIFSLSESIIKKIENEYPGLLDLISTKESFINSTESSLIDIGRTISPLNYRTIVYYTPDITLSDDIQKCKAAFPDVEIVEIFTAAKKREFEQKYKATRKQVIITNKVISIKPDLIISASGFMIGPMRKLWFSIATKVIYHCEDMNTKIKKIIIKNESNFKNKRRS